MVFNYYATAAREAIRGVVTIYEYERGLMKEVEAKRVAQAMLIGAREEVATLRALANAARLAADHPELLRLRELDTVRAFAQTPGNTVVMGVTGPVPLPRTSRPAPKADDNEPEGEE